MMLIISQASSEPPALRWRREVQAACVRQTSSADDVRAVCFLFTVLNRFSEPAHISRCDEPEPDQLVSALVYYCSHIDDDVRLTHVELVYSEWFSSCLVQMIQHSLHHHLDLSRDAVSPQSLITKFS